MWLCDSSIGRKVVMSVTGISLILFLTFHASMNVVALISAEGYNMICEFLGANWYAVVATVGLAGLAVLHILYAIWLWIQNRKARGNNRYAVTATPNGFGGCEKIEWLANQNMLFLGIIVVVGIGIHLCNFWWHMMAAELIEGEAAVNAANGVYWIRETFACPYYTAAYLVWFVAIWFHLTHGFWSAMQTLGWSGKVWLCRWKCIGTAWVTIVMLMFTAVAIAFCAGYTPADCTTCHPDNAQCTMHNCGAVTTAGSNAQCAKGGACADCPKGEGCAEACPDCPKAEGCAEDCADCPKGETKHCHRDKAVHDDCAACEPMKTQGAE